MAEPPGPPPPVAPPQPPRKRGRKPRPRPEDDSRDRHVNMAADPSKGGTRGYDVHFRKRVLAAADAIGEYRAALQFGVSPASLFRWRKRVVPFKMTGGRKSKKAKVDDPTAATTTTTTTAGAGAAATAAADGLARGPASEEGPRPDESEDDDEVDDDEVELLEGPGEGPTDQVEGDRDGAGAVAGADGMAAVSAATAASAATKGEKGAPRRGGRAASEVVVNAYGGEYVHGATFSYDKKKEVASKYRELLERGDAARRGGEGGGSEVSCRVLAAEANVSVGYAQKVLHEIREYGDVLPPGPHPSTTRPKGPGARTLTDADRVVLMQLHAENPRRMNRSYQEELFVRTGTRLSDTCVSRFLAHMFPRDEKRAGGRHRWAEVVTFPRTTTTGTAPDIVVGATAELRGAAGAVPKPAPTPAVAPAVLPDGTAPPPPAQRVAETGPEDIGTSRNGVCATVATGKSAAAGVAVAAPPAPPLLPAPSNERARTGAARSHGPPAREVAHLRTQLEARLLEAAYFVRPLLTPAALTSVSGKSDSFRKKGVQNAYEYLLQDPDDADRFVESFLKSGMGRTVAQAQEGPTASAGAGAAATASPYGMLVDLCAAGYVNRIVSSGKQAVVLVDPNPPRAKASSGVAAEAGPARAAPKQKLPPPKSPPPAPAPLLPSHRQPQQNLPHATHQKANEL